MAILVGLTQEKTKPTQLVFIDEYGISEVVKVDKKYQCPTYCSVDHYHSVYYKDKVTGKNLMVIDRVELKKLKKAYIVKK